jgi:hypothetical protein
MSLIFEKSSSDLFSVIAMDFRMKPAEISRSGGKDLGYECRLGAL